MSIEKEFVPYQESLELKSIEFDEPCFGNYNYNNGEIDYWYDKETQNERTNKWFLDLEKQFSKMNKNGCTAPTFSQAFRWFREKYNLSFECKTPDGQDGLWFPEIHKIKGFGNYYDNEGFDSYEEAELACLRKLIQIVKEKL